MKVVNVKHEKCTHYIGRAAYGHPASALGNPFKLQPGEERGATLERYKKWLWQKIQEGDEAVLDELRDIADAVLESQEEVKLGCWCKPHPCHGDIVLACVEWGLREGLF